MRPPLFPWRLLAPALLLCACAPAFAAGTLAQSLSAAAPGANPRVIDLAVRAQDCAVRNGEPTPERLAVIDYSRPSTEPRLWVFDLARQELLFEELVAHGRNSGENRARSFSNAPGSLESSLGLFRTLGTYSGRNGYSLRMDGLEPGVNDNALERALVIHGAPYVSTATARRMGRLGRSWGCPAVRPAVAQRLIDTLKGGQMVFSYYPDARWLRDSRYLRCDGGPAAVAAIAPHTSGRSAAAR